MKKVLISIASVSLALFAGYLPLLTAPCEPEAAFGALGPIQALQYLKECRQAKRDSASIRQVLPVKKARKIAARILGLPQDSSSKTIMRVVEARKLGLGDQADYDQIDAARASQAVNSQQDLMTPFDVSRRIKLVYGSKQAARIEALHVLKAPLDTDDSILRDRLNLLEACLIDILSEPYLASDTDTMYSLFRWDFGLGRII